MWPLMLTAILVGVAFEMTKYAILEIRRNIHNRNRPRKNQQWRTNASRHATPRGRGVTRVALRPPPDFAKDLCKQWNKVHDSLEEMLKFGDMLIELEDYVDNSFIFNEDGIVGRMPGIKGFLKTHCPHVVYTTAMRYRTLALKARESENKGKFKDIRKECQSINVLGEKLDECLSVEHRHLQCQRRTRRVQKRLSDSPQPAIFALREQTHSDIEALNGAQRQRYVDALRELVHEFAPP